MSLRLPSARRKKRRELKPEDLSFLRKDLSQWNVNEVGMWLCSIDLPMYQDLFFFNEVDGEMLADIDEDDLLSFPIDKIAHRKKILRRIQILKGVEVDRESGDTRSDLESLRSSDTASTLSSLRGRDGVRIKCAYHDDIRAVDLDPNETYEQFKLKILEEFGANKSVKYKDQDGDLVTIKNDGDVRAMVAIAATKSVKVIVYSSRKKRAERSSSKSRGKKSNSDRKSRSSSSSKKDRYQTTSIFSKLISMVFKGKVKKILMCWRTSWKPSLSPIAGESSHSGTQPLRISSDTIVKRSSDRMYQSSC
jgi:hypothetical protein